MKSKLAVIMSALVFIAGLTIYIKAAREERQRVTAPFVITYSYYKVGGNPATNQVIIQKVAASGNSRIFRYHTLNGVLTELPMDDTDLQHARLKYTREMWKQYASTEALKNHPEYSREDEFMGRRVYVTKFVPEPNQNLPTVEKWYAPEFGPISLKRVYVEDDKVLVAEATNIEFKEVSEEEVK
jgi:hypothetical protein